MSDESNDDTLLEEPAINVLTQEEHLESILFQFVTLHEQWSKDRKVAARQGANIEKFVQEFALEVERFSKIEDYTIAKLKKGLEQATERFATMLPDTVSHAVNRALDDSAGKIKDSVRQAERMLIDYQSSLNWSHWKTIAVTAFSSIVTSLLIVWWLMPAPTLPLTNAQIATYHNGQLLESFWPNLSKRQQDWLFSASLGKKNREKLFEDEKQKIKDEYPGMSEADVNKMANNNLALGFSTLDR
jgi:hypothetical protein